MSAGTDLRAIVAELPSAAARQPLAEALRHKRRGTWFAWSWADVLAQADRLGETLRARGIGAQSLVAISGDYAPNLVLLAIAAAQLGASVATVPIQADAPTWVARHRPDLVFLGQRGQAGAWRAALDAAASPALLVVDVHLPWGHAAGAGFVAAADFLGDPGGAPSRASSDVLWIEESTDWADGLSFILRAAASGRSLAFPESLLAAHRDRREIQPAALALSPAHLAELSSDLASRLPAGGGVAGRLTGAALAAGRGGRAGLRHRWLLRRLRRPFGLARLRDLILVAEDGRARPDGDLFAALGIRAAYAPPSDGVAQPRGLVFA